MTLDELARLRLAGQRPAGDVHLLIGSALPTTLSDCTIVITDSTPVARLDLRPLLGLNIVLSAERYSEAAGGLFERLKDYAESVIFVVDAWLDSLEDMGVVWVKGRGQRSLAEPWEAAA